MVVDGRGVARRDLRRAGDGTADDEGERTGVERLHGLLRRVDMALGDDLGRALPTFAFARPPSPGGEGFILYK